MRAALRRLCLALAVAACQAPPASVMTASTGLEEAKSAGKSLVGEACRFEPDAAPSSDFPVTYAVYCGRWEQPSARLLLAPAGIGTDLAALATSSPWRRGLSLRATCEAPVPAALRHGRAVLLQCRRVVGGWPHVALVATVGGDTFFADGVPASLPAIEAAMEAASGVRDAQGELHSPASDRVAALLAAHPFGSNDLDDFYRFKRLGDAANDAGDYAAAEQAFRGALGVQQKVLGQGDGALASPLMSVALQLSNQGRIHEADQFFGRAASLLKRQPDPLADATLELYLAEHAGNQDRVDEADAHAGRAVVGFAGFVTLSHTALTERRPGSIATDFAGTLFMSPDEERATIGLAASLWFQSYAAYRREDFAQAGRLAARAQTVLREAKVSASGIEPRAVRTIGLSAGGRLAYTEGGASLQRAAGIFSAGQANDPQAAVTLCLAGRNAILAGDPDGALALFRRGAVLARDRQLKLPPRLVELYLSLLARKPGDEAAAREGVAALQLIEQTETSQVLARALVRLAFTQDSTRNLLRTMQDSDLAISRLTAERDAETGRPADMVDQRRVAELEQALAKARAARNQADAAAQAASPEYNQLVETGVTAEAVQAQLRPHEGVIVFQPGRDASYAVLLTPKTVRLARVPLGTDALLARITALRRTIVPGESSAAGLPAFDTAGAHALYDALFGELSPAMGGLDKLVTVPGGALAMLPLDVLVTAAVPAVTDGDYSRVPFLLDRYALSTTPSLRTFLIQRTRTAASAATQAYVGFGDFRPASRRQLAASFPPGECGHDLAGLEGLPALPATRREITFVANSVFHAPASDLVLGQDFTRARLIGMDLRHFRIVHLATHGLLPTDLACRPDSTIVVSPDPSAPDASSAFVGSADVLALRLDADLVLLSACNTGSGGQATGDSLSALARSFFFAGARGLLVTHWDLSDRSAPLLTAATLAPRDGTNDTARALRAAKLLLIHTVSAKFGRDGAFFTHPYAWAAFALVGDGAEKG